MVELNEVYMVDYIRTPFSRARPRTPERDAFSEIRADELMGLTLRNMFEVRLKGKLEPKDVDEVTVGCSLQVGDNYLYGGRNPLFLGNFPVSVPAGGYDKQCGSAMLGMHHGMMSIMSGYADIVVCSGMEHQTRVPMDPMLQKMITPPGSLVSKKEGNDFYRGDIDIMTGFQMTATAQKLFEEESMEGWATKEGMDKWSLLSHQWAAKATEEGKLKGEIVPVMAHKEGNIEEPMLIDKDLSIRGNTTLEKIAGLPAVAQGRGYKNPIMTRKEYKEKFGTRNGMITAGNSSPLNAGATTCLLMSKKAMEEKGLEPMVKMVSMGWAAVDPSVMGRGPVPASQMALKHAGLTADDIDFWEINEAFAIVAMNCAHQLGVAREKVNVWGGAIAIGHPLGASGIRLPATLARILIDKKAKYGLANLCCGGGQGVAVLMENVNV
ncbi:MAG: acetyl-CoA C-acyltransferase [archaeon]|nr:acetyl-CoA C-acyltransferase [archaeon]